MTVSGRKVVIGLILLALSAATFLEVFRVRAGVMLIKFKTESVVRRWQSARFEAEGGKTTSETASAVWYVQVVDGEVKDRFPAGEGPLEWDGQLASPEGWPEPDAAFSSRPGFKEFVQAGETKLVVHNFDGREIVVDPAIYGALAEARKNGMDLRVKIAGGQITEIFAKVKSSRPRPGNWDGR